MKRFYFNTGVKYGVNPFLDETATKLDAVGGGWVMGIGFDCEDVPDNAKFSFACDNPTPKNENFIVREMLNTKMTSKYAHFSIN